MSAGGSAGEVGLRALAFVSDDGALWGAALAHPEGGRLVSAGRLTVDREIEVLDRDGGGWRITAAEGELVLETAVLPAPIPPAESDCEPEARPAPGAPHVAGEGPELCRLTGTIAGESVDLHAVAVRVAPARASKDEPGSVRLVAAWLEDRSAVALIGARPRRADRPDQDALSATVFDPERWIAVSDPRLSTTYDATGTPVRVNLELWVGDGENEYPRRAAAEAAGAPSGSGAGDAGGLQVTPLRCHSHGENGTGVYMLARL